MAYDPELAERVLAALGRHPGVDAAKLEEKKMFGGVCYLLGGAMCIGIQDQMLVARASHEAAEGYLKEPGVRPMDFTGKPMKGWLYVSDQALQGDAAIARWVDRCVGFVGTLGPRPAKKPMARAAKKGRGASR